MARFLVRRSFGLLPVLLVVACVVFFTVRLAPGDAATVIAGEYATGEEVARIRAQLELDKPILAQFSSWLVRLSHGDLGQSIFYKQPVAKLIGERLGPTLTLTVTTMVAAILLAVPCGVLAARSVGALFDRTLMATSVLAFSMPAFVLAYSLIYVFAFRLEWLPVQGYTPFTVDPARFAKGIVLPSLTLGFIYAALIARMTRASMIEALGQDYVRSARAKGVPPGRLLIEHALRNASIPIVTPLGTGVSHLVGGVAVTESVFNIPGLGRLTVDAIVGRDYPVIQGVTLVFAMLCVALNVLVDIAYLLLDPRIRLQ